MPFHELVVADATHRGRGGRWRIAADAGRITHHEAPAYVVASGGLVASSTTSTAFHLDQETA